MDSQSNKHSTVPLFLADGVSKSFGNLEVLKNVSLTVESGDVTCILGPSGAGKSTFLRCINMLETVDHGSLYLEGECLGYERVGNKMRRLKSRDMARQRAKIGMVFQGFNLFPHMNALRNVAEGPRCVTGLSKTDAEERARELLALMGLADKVDVYPQQLSGGQQQRVAIARAMAMEPALMLFDEPTSSLDPELVGEVIEVMERLAASGMTMVCVTHEISFASRAASNVVFMDRGSVLEQGDRHTMLNNPGHERTQRFLERVR